MNIFKNRLCTQLRLLTRRTTILVALCTAILSGFTTSTVATPQPHEQVLEGVNFIRQNDLKGLLENFVPQAEFKKMEAQWEKDRQQEVTDEQRAEFHQTVGLLLLPNAEDTLMMVIEPQLEIAKGQWAALVPMFEGLATMGIESATELDGTTKAQAAKVVKAMAAWARENDLTSPALARQALSQVVATFKALDVTTLDDIKALNMDELLQRGDIALAGMKNILAVYDIQIDEMLDSITAETLSVEGETAKVKFGMSLFGEYIESESNMVLQNGRWVDVKTLESLTALTAKKQTQNTPQTDESSAKNTGVSPAVNTARSATPRLRPVPVEVSQESEQPLTAAQSYLAYKQALTSAGSLPDVASYWSAWLSESLESKSNEAQQKKFMELKNAPQPVQVIGETHGEQQTTLRVAASHSDSALLTGSVTLKIEDAKWKIDQIIWSETPLQVAVAERPAEVLEPIHRSVLSSDETLLVETAETESKNDLTQSLTETKTETQDLAAVEDKSSSVAPQTTRSEQPSAEILQAQFDRNPFFKRFNIKLTALELADGFLTAELTNASPTLLNEVRAGFDLAEGNVATLDNEQDRPAALSVQKVLQATQSKYSLAAVLLLAPSGSPTTENQNTDSASKSGPVEQTTDATPKAEPDPATEVAAKQEIQNAENKAAEKEQAEAEQKAKRRERIRQIQLRLAELGYEPGPADGKAGRGTRSAISSYQENAGLTANGEPTEAVLAHMNSPDAIENDEGEVILIDPDAESSDESQIVEVIDPDDEIEEEPAEEEGKVKGFFGKLFKKKDDN